MPPTIRRAVIPAAGLGSRLRMGACGSSGPGSRCTPRSLTYELHSPVTDVRGEGVRGGCGALSATASGEVGMGVRGGVNTG